MQTPSLLGSRAPKPSDLMVSSQVCELLGIDPSTLTRRVARGDQPQPVGKLAGKTGAFLFNRADVEAIAQGGAR